MVEITTYKHVDRLKIPVNNKQHLLLELIETDKKENNQMLKVTRLDERGDIDGAEYISEADLVLLWNLYIYKKQNKEEIF